MTENADHLFVHRMYIGTDPTGDNPDTGKIEPSVLIGYDIRLNAFPLPGLTQLLGESWWQR